MSEFENKYAEILSHFTEPDVPLRPDALISDEEEIDTAEDTQDITADRADVSDNTEENETKAEINESSLDDGEKPVYIPLSKETQSNITAPLKKKIPWRAIAVTIAAVVLVCGIIFSLPEGAKDDVNLFTDSMLSFAKKDKDSLINMYGVVNKRGKIIADAQYSMTYLPGENVILSSEGSDSVSFYTGSGAKFALVSKRGKQLTKFILDDTAGKFSQNLMAASKDGKWGYINKKGKWKIKPKYADAYNFSENLAGVRNTQSLMWGYINKSGKKVIDFRFEEIGEFKDGIAPVKENGKWGYIDKKGEYVIKNTFSDVGTFENGKAIAVNSKGKWGYINQKGKWVIKAAYDELREFSGNLSAAKKDGKWGYIDKDGKKAINKSFDMASDFNDKIALVKTENSFCYINTDGEKTIDDTFTAATDFFDDGYAVVCKEDSKSASGEKWYIINKKGKKIFKRTFESM